MNLKQLHKLLLRCSGRKHDPALDEEVQRRIAADEAGRELYEKTRLETDLIRKALDNVENPPGLDEGIIAKISGEAAPKQRFAFLHGRGFRFALYRFAPVCALVAITAFIIMTINTEPEYMHEAEIISVEGTAAYQLPGSDEWTGAVSGSTIVSGTKFKCAPDARIQIDIDYQIRLICRNLNHLKLELDKEFPFADLTGGDIHTVVAKGNDFSIRTPHSKVKVIGTEFITSTDAEKTTVTVAEGNVEMSNDMGSTEIGPSFQSVSTADEAPEKPKKVNIDDYFSWVFNRQKVKEEKTAISFKGLRRAIPGPGEVVLTWEPALGSGPFIYKAYISETPGDYDYNKPAGNTSTNSYLEISDIIPGKTYSFTVKAFDAGGNMDENTIEQQVFIGDNLDFESEKSPGQFKPLGWYASQTIEGEKESNFTVVDDVIHSGKLAARITTSGTPEDENDVTISSLAYDPYIYLKSKHTYRVRAAVKRSHSQPFMLLVQTYGHSMVFSQYYDFMDQGNEESDWGYYDLYFRVPTSIGPEARCFLRIDSIISNKHTQDEPCYIWVDDVSITDLGEDRLTVIQEEQPKVTGVVNGNFNQGTREIEEDINGRSYSSDSMPEGWSFSTENMQNSNDAADYPVLKLTDPVAPLESGRSLTVSVKAEDISAPACAGVQTEVHIPDSESARYMLGFNYRAKGITLPAFETWIISPDGNRRTRLFIDSMVRIPARQSWPNYLVFMTEENEESVELRFNCMTLSQKREQNWEKPIIQPEMAVHTSSCTSYMSNVKLLKVRSKDAEAE